MSELAGVHCAGAPRDLGLDQGRTFAEQIRRQAARLRAEGAFARWFFERSRSGRAAAVRRDTLRYFPHMGERAMGVARGAGVGEVALAGLLGRSFDGGEGGILALAGDASGRLPRITRTLASGEQDVIVRHSAPDTDFASVDLALPWRVSALAGVNEHGLAVASVSLGVRPHGHSAPAALMTQDCLQRFDLVEKAVDWLLGRPAGGAVSFVLADATGVLRAVDVSEEARTVREPEAGVLTAGDPRSTEHQSAALAAAAASQEPRDAEAAARLTTGPRVVLDPGRRGFGYAESGGEALAWYESGKSAE